MKIRRLLKWLLIPLAALLLLMAFYLFSARYKGVKETIQFSSDITLDGLLIRPDTPGPHPAILLLHGSGERHQTYDKMFFKFHANAFLEKGIAVMVYTKRGSGSQKVDYDNFTYKQLTNDALAALRYLRSRPDIDQDNIGLMGVSESGWFTPEMAAVDGNIRFIINRVSSPFTVAETVIHEVKMDALREGFTETQVEEEIVPLTEEIWQYYIDVAKDPSKQRGIERDKVNQRLKAAHNDPSLGKWFTFSELAPYDSLHYASRGQNFAYDPLTYLKSIDVPMLYVMGGKDINIPTARVVAFMERFKRTDNKDITVKVFPEASHYLYKYSLEDGPYEGWLYEDGYMDLITNWAVDQIE